MITAPDPDEVLTLRQVAEILHIDYETARLWVEGGVLRATKIRGRWFIRRRWVDELIDGGG